MLATDPAFEAQLLGVAHPRSLELDRPRGSDHTPRLIAVAVAHRLARSARVRGTRLPRPRAPAAGSAALPAGRSARPDRPRRRHRPTPHRAPRNRSLGATLAMRAYRHRFDWSGQSGGYARPTFPRVLGRHLAGFRWSPASPAVGRRPRGVVPRAGCTSGGRDVRTWVLATLLERCQLERRKVRTAVTRRW